MAFVDLTADYDYKPTYTPPNNVSPITPDISQQQTIVNTTMASPDSTYPIQKYPNDGSNQDVIDRRGTVGINGNSGGTPPTWDSTYQMWRDPNSGSLWDSQSGLWISVADLQNPQVYNDQVGWQSVAQYNDYNKVLSEMYGSKDSPGGFTANPYVAQPSLFTPQAPAEKLSNGEWQDVQQWMDTPKNYTLNNPNLSKIANFDPGDVIDRSALRQTDPMGPQYQQDVRFPTGGGMLGSGFDNSVTKPLSGLLGNAYGQYQKYIQNPIAETGAQLTPAALSLLKYEVPGASTAFGIGKALTGYNPDSHVAPGLEQLGSAASNPSTFISTQNKNLAERPGWQQMAATAAYDPLNLVGAGLGAKALEGGALEGTGVLSKILRGAAKVDTGIEAAQNAALKPIGFLGKGLANAAGEVPAGIAARAALGVGAGVGTYAMNPGDLDPTERLLVALGVGTGAAFAPDLAKKGYDLIPKVEKTALNIPAIATLEPLPLGTKGIADALGRKEETTAVRGKLGELVGRIPGSDKVAGAFNPSVTLDRVVHVANQAKHAVMADLNTRFASTRKPILDQIKESFGEWKKGADGYTRFVDQPEYLGPADRTIAGTLVDILEHPQDYVLNPFQKATLDLIESRDAMNVNYLRQNFGVDVSLFKPEGGEGKYAPRINTNKDLVKEGIVTQHRLESPSIGKPRSYETAAERMAHDAETGAVHPFMPETDPVKLFETHDKQLASMAGRNTFIEGIGGQTKMQLIEEHFPEILEAKKKAQLVLTSLKGKLERRTAREADLAAAIRKNLSNSRQIEERMQPFLDVIRPLEESQQYGPELSHLTGQVYELQRELAVAEKMVEGTPKKPGLQAKLIANDAEIRSLRAQVETAQAEAEKLVKRYSNANFAERAGKKFSPETYRYHDPSVAAGISKLQQDVGVGEPVIKAFDYLRGTALSGDASPVTIQGVLGALTHPIETAKTSFKMFLEGGPSLDDVARREPEMVARYTQAKARALGKVSDEFNPAESLLAFIPKAGKKFTSAENAMFSAIQRIDYEAWKSRVAWLKEINPGMTDNVADHEAANALSKSVPSMSSVERGLSIGRSKYERAILTSSSFLAAPAAAMKDAASAVAKMAVGKTPRGREQIALRHILQLNASIALISGGTALATADARNLSPEEALRRAFDPNRKEFMSIQLPNGSRIPLGGPYRSFFKAMNPIGSDGKPQMPNLVQWSASKLSPAVRTGVDVLRNQDFYGNNIRTSKDGNIRNLQSLEYFVTHAMAPITLSSVDDSLRRGDSLSETVTGALGQLAGSSPQPATPTDKLDSIARAFPGNEGRDYWESPAGVQREIRNIHPDVYEEYVQNASEKTQAAYKAEQQAHADQLTWDTKLDKHEISGADWRNNYNERYGDLSKFKQGLYATAGTYEGKDPVLDNYFKVIDDAQLPDGTVDWSRVDAYMGSLSKDDRQYIDDNTHLAFQTSKTKEYRDDMFKISESGYWNIDDSIWRQFAEAYKVPDTTTKEQYWAGLRQDLTKGAEEYLDSNPALPDWRTKSPNAANELANVAFEKAKGKYDSALSDARKKWRGEHLAEAQILAKWGLGGTGAAETQARISEANKP